MKYVSILFLLLWQTTSDLHAQACCSAGTPLSAQLGLEFLQKGDLLFNLAYDYNYLNDQFNYREKLKTNDRSRVSQNILFRVQYGISKRWSVALSIPYVYRSENTGSSIEGFSKISSSGIGDLLVQTNFTIIEKGKNQLLLSAGLKMPTGSNDETNDLGIPLPADLQPGTGSWDGIVAALYQMNNIWGGNFQFNASATARFNGKGTRFDGRQSYHFGNAYSVIIGLNYEVFLKKSYLVPSLNIGYRRTMIDITNNSLTPSTGGDWVSLIPGLGYYFNDGIMVLVSSSIPVFRYLEGTQLTTTYRLFFQFQYTLKTRKNEISLNF
jgi:hypothetical protein